MPLSALARAFGRWASGAGAATRTPESDGIVQTTGFDSTYSSPVAAGGKPPPREVFNWLLASYSDMLATLREHGSALPWDALVDYLHPAIVTGSDDNLYVSTSSSGPATSDAQDPTAAGATKWQMIASQDATTGTAGITRYATKDEVAAGSAADRAVTPASLRGLAPRLVQVTSLPNLAIPANQWLSTQWLIPDSAGNLVLRMMHSDGRIRTSPVTSGTLLRSVPTAVASGETFSPTEYRKIALHIHPNDDYAGRTAGNFLALALGPNAATVDLTVLQMRN